MVMQTGGGPQLPSSVSAGQTEGGIATMFEKGNSRHRGTWHHSPTAFVLRVPELKPTTAVLRGGSNLLTPYRVWAPAYIVSRDIQLPMRIIKTPCCFSEGRNVTLWC